MKTRPNKRLFGSMPTKVRFGADGGLGLRPAVMADLVKTTIFQPGNEIIDAYNAKQSSKPAQVVKQFESVADKVDKAAAATQRKRRSGRKSQKVTTMPGPLAVEKAENVKNPENKIPKCASKEVALKNSATGESQPAPPTSIQQPESKRRKRKQPVAEFL